MPHVFLTLTGFPLGTEKPGKMGRHFFQSGKNQEILEKSENHTKYWKSRGISEKYYLLFLVIFK